LSLATTTYYLKKLKPFREALYKRFFNFVNKVSFDSKGFDKDSIEMVLVSLLITYTIAYQVNIRKEKIYAMETLISVKAAIQFTSNTLNL
jgi:hypothetical protein